MNTYLILKEYQEYIENLANTHSEEIFSNGGKDHASILMATMLNHTKNRARIFCEGFKADLIHTEPYFQALKDYLGKGRRLSVLVENDKHTEEAPIQFLKKHKSENQDAEIELKKIKEEDKKKIFNALNSIHCNFAVFDDDKFRLEYIPEEYKAMGSFNQPEKCRKLTELFDAAFQNAETISLV